MKIWMIWVQGDDTTWLEGCWDDESTAQNPEGWQAYVDRCKKLAHDNNYEVRIASSEIKGVYGLFETSELEAPK